MKFHPRWPPPEKNPSRHSWLRHGGDTVVTVACYWCVTYFSFCDPIRSYNSVKVRHQAMVIEAWTSLSEDDVIAVQHNVFCARPVCSKIDRARVCILTNNRNFWRVDLRLWRNNAMATLRSGKSCAKLRVLRKPVVLGRPCDFIALNCASLKNEIWKSTGDCVCSYRISLSRPLVG